MARWTRENDFDNIIRPAANELGVPVSLVKAHIAAESAFNPGAYKAEPKLNDASRGLAQVLLSTARALGYQGAAGDDTTRTGGLYDPYINVPLAVRLMRDNLDRAGGKVDVAVSAYNAGFSAIRPGDGKRTSTNGPFINQAYVDRVLNYMAYFQRMGADGPAAAATPTVPPPAGGLTLAGVGIPALIGAALLVWLLSRLR